MADLGRGVYFTDCLTKAVSFGLPNEDSTLRNVIVADVAVGEVYETYRKHQETNLTSRHHSILGSGQRSVLHNGTVTEIEDLGLPSGAMNQRDVRTSFPHNEVVVQWDDQIRYAYNIEVRVVYN